MNSRRDGLARSVQVRLARHARSIGVDPNLVLTRYAVERLLYRLSVSPHAERFVLKGALLLLVWLGDTLRPTRDADLLGFGDLSVESLAHIFKEVCKQKVEPDAVDFHSNSIRVEPIRIDDAYGGHRITLTAELGAARLRVQVDVGIGDIVVPEPVWLEYPGLLDMPQPRLRAYTRESVIAEKLHALVLLGSNNSRMKDYFDLYALLREGATSSENLSEAIAATFQRRRTTLPQDEPPGLGDAFADSPMKQAQWAAFLAKNRLQAPDLRDVICDIRRWLTGSLEKARGNITI